MTCFLIFDNTLTISWRVAAAGLVEGPAAPFRADAVRGHGVLDGLAHAERPGRQQGDGQEDARGAGQPALPHADPQLPPQEAAPLPGPLPPGRRRVLAPVPAQRDLLHLRVPRRRAAAAQQVRQLAKKKILSRNSNLSVKKGKCERAFCEVYDGIIVSDPMT